MKGRVVRLTLQQQYTVAKWLEDMKAISPIIPMGVRKLAEEATKLFDFTVTQQQMHKIVTELGFETVNTVAKKESKARSNDELLLRIKRIEKFLATAFTEEWSQTVI